MNEQRKNQRFQTFAKVKIKGIGKKEIKLKDISITGCRLACSGHEEIAFNKHYKLEITPESDAEIGLFNLLVEAKWSRAGDNSGEIGFVILESPKGKQFQRYVDYLSWRYSQGNSMTGETAVETAAASLLNSEK